MKDEQPPENHPLPPLSSVAGTLGLLLQHRLISAPVRPGEPSSLGHYEVLSLVKARRPWFVGVVPKAVL